MAKIFYREKLIQYALETTYGTNAISGGATPIPVYAKNVTFTPGQGEQESNDYIKPYLGNDPVALLVYEASLEFEIELPATGAAGTALPLNTLLQIGYLNMTVTPVGPPPKVTHALISPSANPTSATFYFRIGTERHALVGCVAEQLQFMFERKKRASVKFTIKGTHVAPVKEAMPAADYSIWTKGVVVSKTNTPTGTLDGYAPCIESMTVTIANTVSRRDLINCNAPILSDRKVNGSVKIDAPELDAKNYWSLARSEIPGVLALVHGPSGGRQWKIDCPKVQVLEPKVGESDGVYSNDLELNILPNTGNDDVTITTL